MCIRKTMLVSCFYLQGKNPDDVWKKSTSCSRIKTMSKNYFQTDQLLKGISYSLEIVSEQNWTNCT